MSETVDVQTILDALAKDPGDVCGWYALADALEESGDHDRAELSRYTTLLRLEPDSPYFAERQKIVQSSLVKGVRPCWPTRETSFGMKFSLIPRGARVLGRGREQEYVKFDTPFWMSTTLVTKNVLRYLGISQIGYERDVPALAVDYNLIACRVPYTLNLRNLDVAAFDLPSAAQWEYACRAGTKTNYNLGDTTDALNAAGYYAGSFGDALLAETVRRMLERQRSHFRDHDGSAADDAKEKPHD